MTNGITFVSKINTLNRGMYTVQPFSNRISLRKIERNHIIPNVSLFRPYCESDDCLINHFINMSGGLVMQNIQLFQFKLKLQRYTI